ncbi:ATP-dependent helicase HrpB [Opitutus terrae]|uniref:Helicase ATP-dependent domain protein n=1 Tax=Opitutus terrae (strain DSM 11246 / JCM 15787 / PB90-1) TaxID=452637 RepID=B1ZU70_OPITP|nr:ATP-dependent helicase HrpB [Opitutus terrae]ACB76636.1 Helicase ATP-dependent domain protein [Opitutus terrae PB90-1]
MSPRELPIYELESAVVSAVRAHGRLIVQAPTGSGKSTQIPQMLLQHGLLGERGEVVVLQPRRLAARLLAKRVAEEMGSRLGDTVGYQIRLESRVSDRTRIRFVTEGILLRQMSFDASLRGVSAVVFDEFHERHLYGDISLARALQIQQSTRPDLKILVMSATLDAGALQTYLAPCETLVSQGRSFPVRIEYLPKTVNFDHDAVWDVAARECERIATTQAGDMLVFMPGAYEISRTVQAIQGSRALRDCVCFPLHGELPPDAQDRAVARYDTRKIIVSTNVAETSLTIEGVTAVIDSGLARMARFDPHRGINTLLIEKISAASADQRAGRAGRTAPGVCVRLWTEREHAQRAPQELPEVKRLDLAEVVLTLKASGIDDVANFPWLEKPDPKALERAEMLLADLGAIGAATPSSRQDRRDEGVAPPGETSITDVGRKMLRFPVHPRYARMLLAAQERGCVRPVALMAALTQGRSFLLRGVSRDVDDAREDALGEEHESDFFLLMRAWSYADRSNYSLEACRRLGIHAQAARQVGPLFQQFLEIAEKEGLDVGERRVESSDVRKCVLAGFSDHLAKRLDAGTLRCELVHQRRGLLARESAIHKAPLLVAAEISEVEGRGGEINVLLSLATAIEEPWLEEIFPDDYRQTRGVVYDEQAKRVVSRRERRFRDLVLEAKVSGDEAPLNEAAALLTKEVLAGRIKLEAWDEAVEQWITRVNRMAEWFPELEVNPITDADRATLIEQVCYGELSARDVRDKPVMPVLRDWLTQEQLAVLDDYLPERLTMANGRRSKLRYENDGPPILSARIQELYGINGKFTIGHGRVPVKIEVLAPNQRPIQVTDDLTNFWREQYPKIKTELSRRYPRHEWR